MKKLLFISLLFLVAVSSSVFMVMESARFYISHYVDEPWRGYWLASMLEVFVMLLAMIRIGGFWRQLTQKSLMFVIFCIIIFAAGLYAVEPTLKSFTTAKQSEELKQVLGNELEGLKEELNVFKSQNQRGNTAKTAIRKEKVFTELKELLKKDVVTNKNEIAVVNIILLFVIRLAVQTANIYCAWMIGFIYRSNGYVKSDIKPKGKPPLCICGCGEPVKWSKAKNDWNLANDGHQFRPSAIKKAKELKQQEGVV